MRPAVNPFPVAALLATMLAVTTAFAIAAAPALADITGGDPPDYVLEEDGTVVIDGDLATDCPSFAEFVPSADGDPDLEQARSVLEQCEEAGLLPSGGTTSSASDALPAGASASSEASAANGKGGGLSDTGGPNLPALLGVSGILAIIGGLLSRKIATG